ncbi:MAG: hypothetical protein M3020_09990 [Myxococcota bacterium]|nr:hypothetical protein [Myxococcota bacterium]
MTIRVRVTWPNAGHPFLPEAGAKITVEADGASVPEVSRAKGVREFSIETVPGKIVMKAEFSTKLRAVGLTPPQEAVVLTAAQRYRVTSGGNDIRPEFVDPFQQHHPLVDSKILTAGHTAILAQIQTDFVNVTPLWNAYTQSGNDDVPHLDQYKAESNPGSVTLTALGYTKGKPLLWFASIPNAAFLTSRSSVPALVYYRPALQPYTRLDQRHTHYRLNRFLLSPDPSAPASDFLRADRFLPMPGGGTHYWLRCGFERSLAASNKELVMLHPWPSGTDFGDAANKALPGAAQAALRFLWSEKLLAANRFQLSLGRLGLMGYSAGGAVLWRALGANGPRTSEVYAIDANQTGAQGALLSSWFRGATERGEDPRLFMAVGLHVAQGAQVTAQVAANMAKKQLQVPADRLLSLPRLQSEYANGTIPDFVRVAGGQRAFFTDPSALHQFPAFGRYPRTPGEPAAANPTFLQRFLELSGF